MSRYSRFLAGLGGNGGEYPFVMVDSGNNAKAGPAAYIAAYSTMVDASMARAPKADVQAYWTRQGNKVNFSMQVKNLSGKTLNSNNDATLNILIYEEAHLQLTGRFVVYTQQTAINSLVDGATGHYNILTGDLIGVDWARLHYIALVDYKPSSTSNKYDMLQAAVAVPSIPTQVQPDQLYFLVDTYDTTVPPKYATVQGPSSLTWNASESAPWLAVTATGSPSTPVQFTVDKNLLTPGSPLQAVVTFSSPDGALSDQVTVKAYLGDLFTLFLPMTAR